MPADQLIGRHDDVRALVDALQEGRHQVLTGPGRNGKTSVARAAVAELEVAGWHSIKLDLLHAAGVADLVDELVRAAPSAGAADRPSSAPARPSLAEALHRLDETARDDGARLVMLVDEAQELVTTQLFGRGDELARDLRAALDGAPNTVAVFVGGVPSVLRGLFTAKDQPLYQLADLVSLEPVSVAAWNDALRSRFAAGGCDVKDDALERLLDLGSDHPRAIMVLAGWTFLLASGRDHGAVADASTIDQALDAALAAESSIASRELARLRGIGKHTLTTTMRMARGQSPYKGLAPAIARQTLRSLELAGVVEHPRSGAWRIADPLFREYLLRGPSVADAAGAFVVETSRVVSDVDVEGVEPGADDAQGVDASDATDVSEPVTDAEELDAATVELDDDERSDADEDADEDADVDDDELTYSYDDGEPTVDEVDLAAELTYTYDDVDTVSELRYTYGDAESDESDESDEGQVELTYTYDDAVDTDVDGAADDQGTELIYSYDDVEIAESTDDLDDGVVAEPQSPDSADEDEDELYTYDTEVDDEITVTIDSTTAAESEFVAATGGEPEAGTDDEPPVVASLSARHRASDDSAAVGADVARRLATQPVSRSRERPSVAPVGGPNTRDDAGSARFGRFVERIVARHPEWYWQVERDGRPIGGVVMYEPHGLIGRDTPTGLDPVVQLVLVAAAGALAFVGLLLLVADRAWDWGPVAGLLLAAFIACGVQAILLSRSVVGRARASMLARRRNGRFLEAVWHEASALRDVMSALARELPDTAVSAYGDSASRVRSCTAVGFAASLGGVVVGILDPSGPLPVRTGGALKSTPRLKLAPRAAASTVPPSGAGMTRAMPAPASNGQAAPPANGKTATAEPAKATDATKAARPAKTSSRTAPARPASKSSAAKRKQKQKRSHHRSKRKRSGNRHR
ncbi:MAG: AAA family ATPase [Acidimicrobiales bacterium]